MVRRAPEMPEGDEGLEPHADDEPVPCPTPAAAPPRRRTSGPSASLLAREVKRSRRYRYPVAFIVLAYDAFATGMPELETTDVEALLAGAKGVACQAPAGDGPGLGLPSRELGGVPPAHARRRRDGGGRAAARKAHRPPADVSPGLGRRVGPRAHRGRRGPELRKAVPRRDRRARPGPRRGWRPDADGVRRRARTRAAAGGRTGCSSPERVGFSTGAALR